MATQDVLVIAVAGNEPVVVDAADAALAGQVIIDFVTANPNVPEFAVDVKTAVLQTV